MLQDVADLNLSDNHGKFNVPRQLVITGDPLSIPGKVARAGLRFPLVAKPLESDGSAKSHELYLAYDQFSLSKLKPPLVLQEFINHGDDDTTMLCLEHIYFSRNLIDLSLEDAPANDGHQAAYEVQELTMKFKGKNEVCEYVCRNCIVLDHFKS